MPDEKEMKPSIPKEEMFRKSVETQNISIQRKFSTDELENLKTEFCNVHTNIKLEDIEFDKVNAAHKTKIKEYEAKADALLVDIERTYEFQTIKCHLIPNFDENVMECYNEETGEFVQERDLLPEERQLKMNLSSGGKFDDDLSDLK